MGNEVNVVKVPHIKGLRITDIIKFAEKHFDIKSYLPEYKTERYPSRDYVCNVGGCNKDILCLVATMIKDEFDGFVQEKIHENEKEFADKRNTEFRALPGFVSLIKDSKVLSSKPGNILCLCRIKWEISSVSKEQ